MRLGTTALALACAALAGCGGDGEGGASGTTGPFFGAQGTVAGTAAANTALAGIAVEVFAPSSSSPPGFSTSAANGTYSVTTSAGGQAPFLIRSGGATEIQDSDAHYPRLYSVSIRGSGTTQLTPLTDLAVARVLNRKLSFVADLRALSELQSVSEAQLSAAQQQVVDYLSTRPSKDNGNIPGGVDVAAVTDFFSMPLSAAPGDPYFEALNRLHDSLMDSESIQGVAEHMLFGNDPPANLAAMLSLDFLANCAVEGTNTGSMPSGIMPINLNASAITFGTFVNLAFLNGDQLSVTAEHSLEQRWVFTSVLTAQSVEFRLFDGRLTFVRYSSAFGSSSLCVPASELSVADKDPSLMALIRLFALALGNPNASTPAGFQCSAAGAFFQNGANLLIIDNNGALRINNPSGPALHLPSLNITINSTFVAPAGQVSVIQPARFTGSRTFKGGSDQLAVAFTSLGQITGLTLIRQQDGGAVQTQSCGTI